MCIQNTSTSTFLCQQCEKSFITSGNLKTHKEKVHGGGFPLPCPHCGKSFQYMESHIKNVHEIRSEVFNCEECDKDEKEFAVNKIDGKYDITDQQSDRDTTIFIQETEEQHKHYQHRMLTIHTEQQHQHS